MRVFKNFRKAYLIMLLPISILLANVTAYFPELVERVYSNGIYRSLGHRLSIITGYFPFSIGEFILIIGFILFTISVIRLIITLKGNKRAGKRITLSYLINLLVIVSVIYSGFVITWGLNYNRLTFAEIADFDIQPISVEELSQVCENLIERTNALRTKVDETQDGVMQIADGKSSVFSRAAIGFEKASQRYSELGGEYGKPKGVVISKVMAYAGIFGVYFPFTGEANVNILTPDSMLPSTIAHEMAHQRGFAREDEANYIAYLISTLHPDSDFQYSGTFLALRHAMNMLGQYDYNQYLELREKYSEGIERDLEQISAFWEKYEGPFESISSEINNLYLKSNRQEDGIYSYNLIVDLLVAEYRLKK